MFWINVSKKVFCLALKKNLTGEIAGRTSGGGRLSVPSSGLNPQAFSGSSSAWMRVEHPGR